MADSMRKNWIDMAKGLGILMITYGHITEYGNPVDTWMSLFKITVFYIVAGYLMASSRSWERRTTGEAVRNVLRNIMIPYVSFSAVSIAVRAGAAWFKHQDVAHVTLRNLYLTVSMRGISTLWFLPAMAIGEILFILILKRKSRILMICTLVWPVIAGVLIRDALPVLEKSLSEMSYDLLSCPVLAVGKALVSVWFLEIGFLGYSVVERIPAGNRRLLTGIVLSVATILIAAVGAPHIDFNNMKLGNPAVWFFLGGITGSFGAMLLFEWLEPYVTLRPLVYFGKNSLILMAAQRCLLLISFAENGWAKTLKLEKEVCARWYLETFLILVLVLMMTFAVIEIINRSERLTWIFKGKKMVKREGTL